VGKKGKRALRLAGENCRSSCVGGRCRRERISHRRAQRGEKAAPGGGLSALGRKDFQKPALSVGEKGRRALRLAGGNCRSPCTGGAAVGRGFPTGGRVAGEKPLAAAYPR